ncbi:MAG TPA: metallophosphoesterase [Polyangia bacterium]|nr:metallophosphoesterase [Polyangia bacterium]
MNGTVTLIVSDLHLGAEASLDDFYADEDFADFLRYHAAQHPRLHLVINGDWIDFLQIDPYPEKRARREDLEEVYPLRMTEDQAVAAAERTMLRHPLFFQALREFLAEKPTRRITVLRGNHDIELAFPAVQARLRLELGSPPGDRLAFPPVCYFERETGLYVEHGCQYDPWNAFHRFDDPFLDRKRRALETPFGSVVVKTFWNRVESEFPYIDKIRPMADSVTAILVQRPTYLLLKFDYFVDMVLFAWIENLRDLLARRPRRALPPPEGTPENAARQLWRRRYKLGRLTGLVLLAILVQFVLMGIKLWTVDAHLRGGVAWEMSRQLGDRFLLEVAGAFAAIVLGRLVRFVMWQAGVKPVVRTVVYRLMVLAAAGLFFTAVVRMFWLPVGIALSAYLVWDATRTLRGKPLAAKNPLERRPLDPELTAALALLERADIRTVVFGHTHGPLEVDPVPGKRFINSGTWVKVVDVRNVREEPTELNTYVLVGADGDAHLMCWRGTLPARRYAA